MPAMLSVLVWVIAAPCDGQTTQPAPDPAATARELSAECDALLGLVVRKPYGWAIPASDVNRDDAGKLPRGAAVVTMGRMGTPAAGLLLLDAGRQLKSEPLKDAARQLARGVLAAQHPTGRIPERSLFANTASPRDVRSAVPPREPAQAALALLLWCLEDKPDDEPIERGAMRCAQWLGREQPPSGGWPVLVQIEGDPNAETLPPPVRLIRLDQRDYRNSTLALVMAQDGLKDPFIRAAMEKAVDHLMKMRIDNSRTALGLWRACYELDGTPSEKIPELQGCVDTLATRYCLQTLMGHYLATGDTESRNALNESATTLAALRYEDGLWKRQYPLRQSEIKPITKGPAPPPERSPFEKAPPLAIDLQANDTFTLPPVLESIERAQKTQRQDLLKQMDRHYSFRQRIALTLVGLSDQPFAAELPQTPEAAREFLASPNTPWIAGVEKGGGSIEGKLRKLFALLVKLRVERLATDTKG
jgi:hypothetical protein